jgi:thiol-disulfide isomerase/thioredoxin
MRSRIRHLLKGLTLCLALLPAAGCDHQSPVAVRSEEAAPKPGEIGSRLPHFQTTDLNGHALSSDDFRGKVVLIDFWATWCQPCKREMPGYQKLLDRYGSRGFVVVGFKFDTMMDMVNPTTFAKNIGVHYPLAIASEGIKGEFGGIDALPTTMIYDRRGILRYKVLGFEYTDAVESVLKPLLQVGQSSALLGDGDDLLRAGMD